MTGSPKSELGAFLRRNPFSYPYLDGFFYREKMRAIHRVTPDDAAEVVLEVGGGGGGLTASLFPESRIVNIDLNADHAVGPLNRSPHISFVCGDAAKLPFGDAGPHLASLADCPIAAIGIDFYSTRADAVPQGYPKEIHAGVLDARSSALESPEEIGRFAAELLAREPAGLALVPNGDLQFVPEPIAREKVARLGRSQTALEEVA